MPVAVITGASRGFGRALTEVLVADGWHVVVDARDAASLARAADQVARQAAAGDRAGSVRALPGDVADPVHQQELIDAAYEAGSIDLLVNNASTLGPSPLPNLVDYPLEALEAVYRVNVIAPLALIQRAVPRLSTDGAVIVNVTSDAAVEGYEGWGGYGSSKAALDQLGNVLAAERPDLRVYRFDPGDMRTQMHQDAFPGEDISDRPEPETVVPALLRLLAERPPSGRYRASDVAPPLAVA